MVKFWTFSQEGGSSEPIEPPCLYAWTLRDNATEHTDACTHTLASYAQDDDNYYYVEDEVQGIEQSTLGWINHN